MVAGLVITAPPYEWLPRITGPFCAAITRFVVATSPLMLTPKVEYTAMLLGATGNVGGQILHLLV